MKVLITGGAGFVGSHVVDAVVAAGHEPRIFDLAPSQWEPLIPTLAARYCNLAAAALPDVTIPAPGATAFYLAGGRPGSYSTELGSDSTGLTRLNTNPCP